MRRRNAQTGGAGYLTKRQTAELLRQQPMYAKSSVNQIGTKVINSPKFYFVNFPLDLSENITVIQPSPGTAKDPVVIDVDFDGELILVLGEEAITSRIRRQGAKTIPAYVGSWAQKLMRQDVLPAPEIIALDLQKVNQQFTDLDQNVLWAFMGLTPRKGIELQAIGVQKVEGALDFLIGASGLILNIESLKSAAGRGKSKNLTLRDPEYEIGLPHIEGIGALFSVTVADEYAEDVLRGLVSNVGKFTKEWFGAMPRKRAWETASTRTPPIDKKARRAKSKAEHTLRQLGEQDQDKIGAQQLILRGIEDYFQKRPADEALYERYAASKKTSPTSPTYRPRFPSGWRPQIPRTGGNCEILKELAIQAGCQFVKKNPSYDIPTSWRVAGNFMLHKNIVTNIPEDLVTSHDDTDERCSDYFAYADHKAGDPIPEVDDIFIEGMLAHPPVVWSQDGQAPYCVLTGNKNVMALRRSGNWDKVSEYYDYVNSIDFEDGPQRGLLVLVLDPKHDPRRYLLSKDMPVPVKNPLLMIGNPKKNPGPRRNGAARGSVPVDQYPDGAVPLDQIPQAVKNDPSFQKSMEMFKKRYGGYPDYAIQAKVPYGMPPALCGIGQLKQLDYWAADSVEDAGNWTHWFHEAGERGGNKAWGRAGILAADPYTERPVMAEQKGVDVKFTPKGIVG